MSCEIGLLHDLPVPINLQEGWRPSVLVAIGLTSTDICHAVSLDLRAKEGFLTC